MSEELLAIRNTVVIGSALVAVLVVVGGEVSRWLRKRSARRLARERDRARMRRAAEVAEAEAALAEARGDILGEDR